MASKDSFISEASKLEGIPNYSVWSFKLRNMMNRDDLWRIVDPPIGTVAPTAAADTEALQVLKNRALTMIALSVKANVIPNITEPDKCWQVLKDLYASGNHSRKLLLRRKLANLRMEEGTSISEFLQQVKELMNEFACIGETIKDPEVVEYVLMALPASYEGLVNSVSYQSQPPSMAELTVILLHDGTRRELREKRSSHEALLVKGKKPGGRKLTTGSAAPKKSGSGFCYYCGSKKHWVRNCPALSAELKMRKAKWLEKASAASSTTTVNLVDIFESSDEDIFAETETELAVN